MSTLGRVVRNASINLVGQVIPLVVAAITIPFTVRWLGGVRFGVLSLAWVLIGYFSVFDLGLGRATTKFVAESLETGPHRIPALVGTAAAAQVMLGILGALVLSVLADPLAHDLLSLPAALAVETEQCFYLLAASLPFALVATSFRGTLEAGQRFGLVNAVRVPINVLYFLLPLLGAAAGWPLPRIVFGFLLLSLLGASSYLGLCVRVFPNVRHLRFETGALRRLLSFGGWVAVSGFAGPILVYFDRFAIIALMSIVAAGQYGAPYELITRLWIIPTSLVSALFPVFSAGQRAPEQVQSLARHSLKLLVLVMAPVTFATLALANDVVRVLLGPQLGDAMSGPLQILAAGLFVNSLAFVPAALLQASGRPDVTGKLHLIELPFYVLLVWILVDAFGLIGAACAWAIRVTVDAAVLFAVAARLKLIPQRSWRADEAIAITMSILAVAFVALLVSAAPNLPVRLGALILLVGGVVVAYLRTRTFRSSSWLSMPRSTS